MATSPATKLAILDALRDGRSLRAAARANGVAACTVLDWCDADPEYGKQYAAARARGYQLLADEIIEISDDSVGDVVRDADGVVIVDSERVARSKLRVDSRKWMLAKMLPKVYGDKVEHEHKGGITLTVSPTENDL